jgi:hypothetical protein
VVVQVVSLESPDASAARPLLIEDSGGEVEADLGDLPPGSLVLAPDEFDADERPVDVWVLDTPVPFAVNVSVAGSTPVESDIPTAVAIAEQLVVELGG